MGGLLAALEGMGETFSHRLVTSPCRTLPRGVKSSRVDGAESGPLVVAVSPDGQCVVRCKDDHMIG
jgi:hypothetical protein